MKKLIYFTDNDLVKNFCGEDGELIDKKYFFQKPERFITKYIICYGLSHEEQVKVCQQYNIKFIYIDNCYFGNLTSYYTKSKCRKNFYRIVANKTSLNEIIKRDDDRLVQQLSFLTKNYGITKFIEDFKYDGEDILIIPPSGKSLFFYELNVEEWKKNLQNLLLDFNKFNIILRERASIKSRNDRFSADPIQNKFKTAYATVSFNSNAAIESLIFGVPSFIYNYNNVQMTNPAAPVSKLLTNETLLARYYPQNRYEWLSHLAYGQFSREEIANGFAKKQILGEL